MNIRGKLIKCISIVLVFALIISIFINTVLTLKSHAKEQNTKDYKKGSDILDDYPGYSSLIDNLLEEHPEWTFTILYTGLDWNTAIKNETVKAHGRNLVQNKSGEWVCSTCGNKAYDNGSWRCASSATVSYYMDPRNSLFEDWIFQFENLKWVDGKYTIEGIEQIIDDCDYLQGDKITYTNTSGKKETINKSYAEVIMESAKKAGISPYHLASRIRQEQGPGENASATATGTYPGYTGYYNFLNVKASGSGSSAIIRNGLSYAKAQGWNTPEKSIAGGAEFLTKEYIQYGQNTLYLQKFDVDDSDGDLYWHQYQQNVSAAKTESMSILDTYKGIYSKLNMPFNFVIPVFENMPTSRCPMPGTQSIVTQNIQITDSSLVVYKTKDTKSTKLATLKKDDKILRIEIGTEKENGYKWDKIVWNDGRKGYVISSEGFKVINDITNCNVKAIAVEPGNVRNGPGTSDTTTLLTLSVGQSVTIIEKGKYNNIDGYDWSRIKLADGTQGSIVSRYLEEISNNGSTNSGKDIVKVTCNGGLSLRQSPGTSARIICYIDKGDELTRIEKIASTVNGYIWDKVVTDSGLTGYVARGDNDETYIEPIKGKDEAIIPEDLKEDSKEIEYKESGSDFICEPDVTIENIEKNHTDVKVKDINGKEVKSGNVGTGYTITYEDKTFTIIKKGDTNGDGRLTPADSTVVLRSYVELEELTEEAKKAADTNKDGKITPADSTVVLRAYVGLDNIEI